MAYNGGITFLEHRIVVLPEWQGLGIGPRLSEEVGQRLLAGGGAVLRHDGAPHLARRPAQSARPMERGP